MRTLIAAVLATLFLGACATGPRTVDAYVQTTAARAPGAAMLASAHYKFERAPQAAGQPAPERLEAMAQEAMARVGMVRDEVRPRIGVQVGGSVNAYWIDGAGGYGRPGWTFGFGAGHAFRGGGIGFGFGAPMWDSSIPAYVSEVSVLMRDLQTGQIVYDTRARHDGPWHDTDNVLAALFVAALEGYPAPSQGSRRVDVPLFPAAPAPAALPTQPVPASASQPAR